MKVRNADAVGARINIEDGAVLMWVKWICPYCGQPVSLFPIYSFDIDEAHNPPFSVQCDCMECGATACVKVSNPKYVSAEQILPGLLDRGFN